jgi:hypothetical protein
VPGVDFAALYAIPDQGFTPNITLARQIGADAPGAREIADQTVEALRRSHPDLVVVRSQEIGSSAVPGVGQEVRFTAQVAGSAVELTQVQVVLALAVEPVRVVVKVAFTATSRQAPNLLPAFQQFVAGLTPGGPEVTA